MEAITGFFTAHPMVFNGVVIVFVIVIVYLVFKQFLKLSFVLLLIALAGAGYHYYNKPQNVSEDVHKIKNFYKDSKKLANKATSLPGEVNKLLSDADEGVEDKTGNKVKK
jgi:polyferredoxin